MKLFIFFKKLFGLTKKKKIQSEKVDETPKPEQQEFNMNVIEMFIPFLAEYGFKMTKNELKKYSSIITFRKETHFIKISGSTHPMDYPDSYGIVLGDGDSEDWFEFNWNSIALWKIIRNMEPTSQAKEYPFPYGDKIISSLTTAKEDLLKYCHTFLIGDLTTFYEIRKKENQDKEPMRVASPDKDGNYHTTYDPTSIEMKKKYS